MARIVLYPTSDTFTDDGLVEKTPVYRDRDGRFWVKLNPPHRHALIRRIVDSDGKDISFLPHSNAHIGGHSERAFVIRSVTYDDLMTSWFNNENDLSEREINFLLLIDSLQDMIVKLQKRLEMIDDKVNEIEHK